MKATIVKRHNKPVIQLIPESDVEKVIIDDMFTTNISDKNDGMKNTVLNVEKDSNNSVSKIIIGTKHGLTFLNMGKAGFVDITNDIDATGVRYPGKLNKNFKVWAYNSGRSVTMIAIGKGTYTLFKRSLKFPLLSAITSSLSEDWHIKYSVEHGYFVDLNHRDKIQKVGCFSTLEEIQSVLNKKL